MYGYRKPNENTLMTNLNSISSSLSSIDTVGLRANVKASADNLIEPRTHSIASTSLLWRTGNKEDRYAAIRNGRQVGSEIYYDRSNRSLKRTCLNSETALHCILVPLLLLTITRQVFDFLGQIWLQIIINFFTIIWLIFAVFGIKQRRISYLTIYSVWALFNTVWNFLVFCIHSKMKEVGLTEDTLSLYTGATSWWNSNGPGCLPYNVNAIQPPISMLQPNIITGCRIDYHLLEATQAAIHLLLSFISSFVCCCLIVSIRRNPSHFSSNQAKTDKPYRLNNLKVDRSKVNQNPSPDHGRRFASGTNASLRRGTNKMSTRSSQHSQSSMRSTRRRMRQMSGGEGGNALPTPRGSTSSVQRSQKYGSLSSRRSGKLRERRGEVSSLTYGTINEARPSTSQRTRLSSLSSADYLPSYQPPHSSNTNLLSSYGEISSVDSYNNRTSSHYQQSNKNRQSFTRPANKSGTTNPTFTGSKLSICSYSTNNNNNNNNNNNSNNTNNNYDDLSYIYGNSSTKNSESFYGASTSNAVRPQHKLEMMQNKRNGTRARNQHQTSGPYQIQAETYEQTKRNSSNGNTMTKTTMGMITGEFHSFNPSGTYASYNMDPAGPIYSNHHNMPNGNSETPI